MKYIHGDGATEEKDHVGKILEIVDISSGGELEEEDRFRLEVGLTQRWLGAGKTQCSGARGSSWTKGGEAVGSPQILSLDVFYDHIANEPVSLLAKISFIIVPMRRKMTLQKLLFSGGCLSCLIS